MPATQTAHDHAATHPVQEMSSADDASPPYPKYMGELVSRAADLLAVRWPSTVVELSQWSGGESYHYVGRLVWTQEMLGPRIEVFDARSGYFVCRSIQGRITEIDPKVWCIDLPDDELARAEWKEQQHAGAGARRSRSH